MQAHTDKYLEKFVCFIIIYYTLTMHSTATSIRTAKSRVTIGTSPTFRSAERAEKRREVLFV